MVVDRETWPEEGRMGRIGAGEYAGAYLLLVPEIQDSWACYISDAPGETGPDGRVRADDFWVADADLERVLAGMEVSWVPAEDDRRLEEEVFDIRSDWALRRRKPGGLRALFRAFRRSPDA
ncbi:hypothetical protein LG634_22940 [Streptomyces bambusae]|uniref:hypothetical protein n=1 Tax=Streptomyces bambusae TaxID=1550616 RepID=UPI001CFD48FC|nr:hypothetical protein [Streptomyces bambusae]MCB5167674.1 hypothetical protein [Streptomyces bambusae]